LGLLSQWDLTPFGKSGTLLQCGTRSPPRVRSRFRSKSGSNWA
jgi:hypothetical protein